jgi:hypothetical protein
VHGRRLQPGSGRVIELISHDCIYDGLCLKEMTLMTMSGRISGCMVGHGV